MLKAKELRNLAPEELVHKEKSLKKMLFELNFQKKYGKVEKPGQFRTLRRDIAKIQTVLNEKEAPQTKASV